ncbi:TetR/AcrR family transcriptional regulator [Nocardia bovistercoris]|uniref:TetR/AcrR family transcriptional regulator n=1 Tax=Nocardia bovistercoris TaxID=2785916 RepID=A0A931N3V6_9NOCA|nr:TetR/AcrR family transcriptional regulator [Nocardia bovistercoris]MBH0776963.1 TetR/AcrR family transcriptional regulator [Nocardia bovistercoris]
MAATVQAQPSDTGRGRPQIAKERMGRLSRAQQQEVTRRKVLDAAEAEFVQRGFRGATVDAIAERANLTRGAVYSNFPGKRALYLEVLARGAELAPPPAPRAPGRTPAEAFGVFASTWAEQLPSTDDYDYDATEQLSSPAISIDLIPQIQTTPRLRHSFSQLVKLDAILLGLAVEGVADDGGAARARWIGNAESVLTILYGATQLSFAAADFVDGTRVITLCEQIAGLEPGPREPGRTPLVQPAVLPAASHWSPPPSMDVVRHARAHLDDDRMVVVLGMHRLASVERLLEVWPRAADLTLVLVTDDESGELIPLARLALADLSRSLRFAFPRAALPRIEIVVDVDGALAAACGVAAPNNNTEVAVLLGAGTPTLRADGPGAARTLAECANAPAPVDG